LKVKLLSLRLRVKSVTTPLDSTVSMRDDTPRGGCPMASMITHVAEGAYHQFVAS